MLDGQAPAAPAGAEGSAPPAGTEPPAAEDPTAKLIEDYRKRQAGAEKARQEAERQRDIYAAELDGLRKAPSKKPEGGDNTDIEARLAALSQDYERKLTEGIAKAEGKALDARFPVARAKFPEVTDAVKLSELEALFGEPASPPTPLGNNQSRQPGPKNIEDMTSAELQAYMKTLDRSVMGLQPR